MTVALYARRKGWPLEEVIVRLSIPGFMLWTARSARRQPGGSIASTGRFNSSEISPQNNELGCSRSRRNVPSIARCDPRFTFPHRALSTTSRPPMVHLRRRPEHSGHPMRKDEEVSERAFDGGPTCPNLPRRFTYVPSKAREGDACIPALPNHHGFNERLVYF
jgi:hypothetical protein